MEEVEEDCNKKPDNVAAAKSEARSRQHDTRVKYFPQLFRAKFQFHGQKGGH